MATIPCLKALVLQHVCENIDAVFYKKLQRIQRYLTEHDCTDVTDFLIDEQELYEESRNQKNNQNNNAVDVLRKFLRSRQLPKITWKETCKNIKEIEVELNIDSVKVKVNGKCHCRKNNAKQTKGCECKSNLRYLAAKLMLRKLYSRHLDDAVLQKYSRYEETYKREPIYESVSTFRAPAKYLVETIEELQAYSFTHKERLEILKNIPEHRLKRSHYILLLNPDDKSLDFSFCPSLFSVQFFKLLVRKAKEVESVNLENCKIVFKDVRDVLRKTEKTITCLNINNCRDVGVDNVFKVLRKHKLDLREISVGKTIKNNVIGYQGFQMFFNHEMFLPKIMTNIAGRVLKLDLTGLLLCDQEIKYILKSCKRLTHLNLNDTKRNICYCNEHDSAVKFDTVNVCSLQELNISSSEFKTDIQVLLLENNPGLNKLYASSRVLCSLYDKPLQTKHLQYLDTLDISFQGGSEYEDFSLLKEQLPASLLYLNTSGCYDVDISHIIVSCPRLSTLVTNASKINVDMACKTGYINNTNVSVPHTVQYFRYLTKLELRYTDVNLGKLMSSNVPVKLRELVIEGNSLTNTCLEYIVNAKVTQNSREVHIYKELYTLHLCNCNIINDLGLDRCKFTEMPSLRHLTVERCSGIRAGTLKRLNTKFKFSAVSLTCYIDDERPRFHATKENIEVVMG